VGTGRKLVSGSPRALALEVVRRVTDEGAFSNVVLPTLLERSRMKPMDRELATELAYGTLRRLLPIDHALGPFLNKPLQDAPPRARAALRVGAYQLQYTRIPDHAAVTETVGVVSTRERGFVNAVLRRVAREGVRFPTGSSAEAVAARVGLAAWAVRELRRQVGDEAEEAAASLADRAPLTLRTNICRTTVEALEERLRASGHEPVRGRIHRGSLRLRRGRPQALPGFREGWFAVQDEASAWVVDVLDPQPGERIVDVCAGPGGKAADIACRAGTVVAADISLKRVGLVAETVSRLAVRTLLLAQDATSPALRGSVDRVLVDAPCSGIGAARRRPELLWRPQRSDLPSLARQQVRIAAGAASLLRPGGVLVYSVCTFPSAETDGVCRAVIDRVPDLRPDPFPGPEGERVTHARLWPHTHGTDAMFVARFRRK
jgi:16S rRNA (cytosine967-C5)-methyltransferase